MNRRFTRRAVARLLVAAPVAFAAQAAAEPAESKKPAGPALTEKQRKSIAKTSGELKKTLAALHKMDIPIGTEPAMVFSPLVRRK